MKRIYQRGPCVPLVDPCDADLLEWAWCQDHRGYARRGLGSLARRLTGKRTVWVHRVVMERIVGRPLLSSEWIDHINRVRLDCRRENLRIVDAYQNAQNNGADCVTQRKCGRWQGLFKAYKKSHYCGLYKTREAAVEAVRKKKAELGLLVKVPT